MSYKILNKKQRRTLEEKIHRDYGLKNAFRGYEVLESSGIIIVTSREVLTQPLQGLDIKHLGLKAFQDGVPTVMGVQLLFREARMHELTEDEAREFIDGRPVGGAGIQSYLDYPVDLAVEKNGIVKRQGKH